MNDQTYTIAKIIGEPKVYGEGADAKTRFAFTCNETGETIHSLFTKFPEHIKEGASLWGHLEEQEKAGKVYSNFFFGKNNPNKKGGMSEADKASIVLAVRQSSEAITLVKKLRGDLELAGVLETLTSDGQPMPDFAPKENTPIDGELASLEESAAAAMR